MATEQATCEKHCRMTLSAWRCRNEPQENQREPKKSRWYLGTFGARTEPNKHLQNEIEHGTSNWKDNEFKTGARMELGRFGQEQPTRGDKPKLVQTCLKRDPISFMSNSREAQDRSRRFPGIHESPKTAPKESKGETAVRYFKTVPKKTLSARAARTCV